MGVLCKILELDNYNNTCQLYSASTNNYTNECINACMYVYVCTYVYTIYSYMYMCIRTSLSGGHSRDEKHFLSTYPVISADPIFYIMATVKYRPVN